MDVLRRINANQNQPRKSYRGHSQTYQEEGQEVQETNQEKRVNDSTSSQEHSRRRCQVSSLYTIRGQQTVPLTSSRARTTS